MGWTFGEKPWTFRTADLKRVRLNADWAAVNGPLGGVIGHLRARAARARRTAWAFLVLLFVTAGAGLVFYLGLPLWQSFLDGRLDTLNATLRTIEAENAKLDGEREELRGKIAETLAMTLDPMLTETVSTLLGHAKQGGALIVYGVRGTVLRARPDLSGFDPVPTGAQEALRGSVLQGNALLLYGDRGTVLRARPDLSGFDRVPHGTYHDLYGATEHGGALLLYGEEGTVLRARPDLSGFDLIPRGVDEYSERLTGDVKWDGALLLYGSRGGVLRARSDLSGFDMVPTETEAWLEGHVDLGNTLLLYGTNGTILRAQTDLSGFAFLPRVADAWFTGHSQLGDELLLYGSGGTVLRALTDLSGFDRVPTGTEASLRGDVLHDGALLLYGDGGTVLRSTPDTSSFYVIPTGTEASLRGVVKHGDTLLIYGTNGTVLKQTTRQKEETEALAMTAGSLGDEELSDFISSLPLHLRNWVPILAHVSALTAITNRRAALDILRDSTNAEIERYDRSPLAYLRDDKALEFERFLALCRGSPDATPEVTTACLTAWQTEQAGGQTWWRALVDQVPPGILLLFLLATSGGLYRYNLRLAGFHDSRADVLTLLTLGRTTSQLLEILAKTPADVGNLTALVMAADKVEMGAIRAKLGQAEIELARALGSEKKDG